MTRSKNITFIVAALLIAALGLLSAFSANREQSKTASDASQRGAAEKPVVYFVDQFDDKEGKVSQFMPATKRPSKF